MTAACSHPSPKDGRLNLTADQSSSSFGQESPFMTDLYSIPE